jgi:hypothetical protein
VRFNVLRVEAKRIEGNVKKQFVLFWTSLVIIKVDEALNSLTTIQIIYAFI